MKEKLYNITLLFIFVAGIVLRLYLYLKNQTLWYDEAALAENILSKSYFELFKGLDFLQAAPACFNIMVKAFYDFCHPQNAFSRDLVLRFIPFVSGILSLPVFYYLTKYIFDNNKKYILIAMALLAFNPCAILYSAQLKQYSTEMLCAIGLLLVFYKMVVQNNYKWKYSIIIAICPWFSYSSFFIIAGGFCSGLLKNWKKCLLYFLPVVISCIIYYFLSLKSVFSVNYSGMDDFWSQGYAFIEPTHPLRLLIRIGELYVIEKPLAIIVGGLIVFAIIRLKKLLFILPFVFAVIASALHKYPFIARLILFLLPIFIIALTSLKGKIGILSKTIIALITVFYLRDYKIDNKIIRTPEICAEKTLDSCVDFINELPSGNYYFLSSSTWVDEIMGKTKVVTKNLDLGFKPKKEKVVYFEKYDY